MRWLRCPMARIPCGKPSISAVKIPCASSANSSVPRILAEKGAKILGTELFADEAQGIFTAEMEGFPHGMRAIGQRNHRIGIQRQHCPTKQSRTDDDFDGDRPNRLSRFARDFRMTRRRIRIELHHTGEIRDRLHPAKSE